MIWHLLKRQQVFLLLTFHHGLSIPHPVGSCKWNFFVEMDFPSHIFAEKRTRWGLFSTHWIPFTASLFQSMLILAQTPELVMLMDFHKPEGAEVFLFGYNSAFIHGIRTSDLHILNYSWPGPDGTVKPSDFLVATLDGDGWMYLTSDFDEGSGRVVMCSYNEVVVFDFATL